MFIYVILIKIEVYIIQYNSFVYLVNLCLECKNVTSKHNASFMENMFTQGVLLIWGSWREKMSVQFNRFH